jgi:hypothetical protein
MFSKKVLFCFLTVNILFLPRAAFFEEQAEEYEEYSAKAAILEKFTHYIVWPEGSDIYDKTKPFVIATYDTNPFDGKLEELYSDWKIFGKRIEIKHFSKLEEISACNLLFLSTSTKNDLEEILSITYQGSILTVSDTKGFADKGVQINLLIRDNNIHFEVNDRSAKLAGLKINTRLLGIAERIINDAQYHEIISEFVY